MIYMIFAVIMLVALELGVLIGVLIAHICTCGKTPGARRRAIAPEDKDGEDRKTEEYDRRWQETMNQLMSYDFQTARRAVRRDADETQ